MLNGNLKNTVNWGGVVSFKDIWDTRNYVFPVKSTTK